MLRGGKAALVVLRDPEVVAGVAEALRGTAGIAAVERAAGAAEARAALDAGPVPRLVLLDVDADRGARGLLDRLRREPRFAGTAVVVAGDAAREVHREPWLPAEVWIGKPFERDDLTTAIHLAISRLEEPPARGAACSAA